MSPANKMRRKMIMSVISTILVLFTLVGTALAATSDTITIKVESDGNGTLSMSPSNPKPGERVDITAKPSEGYELDAVVIQGKDDKDIKLSGDNKGLYFEAPDSNVTITAKFRKVSVPQQFTDVLPSAWYYDDVQFLYTSGITNGTGNKTFTPDGIMTRAELVTMLWRMVGSPKATTEGSYNDVVKSGYYATAVEWATKEGVVNGIGNRQFGPYDPITREQIVTILYRYAKAKNYSMDIEANVLDGFTDARTISGYAKDGMTWACSEKIIQGNNGLLRPGGNTTRAEMAAVLHRFLNINVQG